VRILPYSTAKKLTASLILEPNLMSFLLKTSEQKSSFHKPWSEM